jgi:RNA polymerase sigma-70 factor (ECF subfamily)
MSDDSIQEGCEMLAKARANVTDVRNVRLSDLRARLIAQALRNRLSWEQAEDVAQETISRALARGLDEEIHLEAWARVVARNLCIDELRRSGKVRTLPERLSEEASGCDERLERVEDVHHAKSLRSHVERLPERQRSIIFAIVAGASVPEVAARVGASVRSIEAHLLRARRSLRRCT